MVYNSIDNCWGPGHTPYTLFKQFSKCHILLGVDLAKVSISKGGRSSVMDGRGMRDPWIPCSPPPFTRSAWRSREERDVAAVILVTGTDTGGAHGCSSEKCKFLIKKNLCPVCGFWLLVSNCKELGQATTVGHTFRILGIIPRPRINWA